MNQHQQTILPEGGKARRVYLLLRDEMASGVLAEGSLMPAEQKLAEIHGVSRVTIRRALDALAADGLIEKRAGSGSVVRPRAQSAAPISGDMASLMPQLVEMGRTTTARLISFAYGSAPATIAAALELAEGVKVQTATRVRLVDDMPFSHLTTYVPEEIAAHYDEADLATTPLFELLERSGVLVDNAHQSISATLAAPDVAEALGISVGAALLSLKRVVRDSSGRGVEYLSAYYRPDMFRLEMSLERVGSIEARHWQPIIGPDAGEGA
ncbi:GntR family transcriptional regulator [Roseibium sp.]|uniref:GntR family transcriptional regulator n=1 Tax=Roseibium sp. TaxID=1936156 RepID=UPI003A9699B1